MRKIGLLAFFALVVLFALGAPAFAHSSRNPPPPAATPQDIYNDYVQNHRLTGDYTKDELRAYLNDATRPRPTATRVWFSSSITSS